MVLPVEGLDSVLEVARVVGPPGHIEHPIVGPVPLSQKVGYLDKEQQVRINNETFGEKLGKAINSLTLSILLR